ncbi:MAG: acyltransferase family protein [Promethearchaeota archaeon]
MSEIGKYEKEACSDNSKHVKRLFYVDNLRFYLTVLVILHHLAVGYGGSGSMPIYEGQFNPIDGITTILLTIFTALNQSYFMSIFFLFAGYFTPRAYDKKGALIFSKDRLIRLGIPLLIAVVFLTPLVTFIVLNFAYAVNISFFKIIEDRIVNDTLLEGVGHLWFVQALLLFTVVYIFYRIISDHYFTNQWKILYENAFPTNKVIFLSIGVLAIITFFVRTEFLIGEIFFNFQLAHFTHYIFCYFIGILAYRGRWFDNLSDSQAKLWISVALITIALLPSLLLLADFTSIDPFRLFMGGWTLQSFVYVVWEAVALLSISISLLYIFQKKFNYQNLLLRELSASSYTAYIIHMIIVVSLIILFLPLTMPALVKFFIVSLIAVPLIFLLSVLIRKIPFTDRVLG